MKTRSLRIVACFSLVAVAACSSSGSSQGAAGAAGTASDAAAGAGGLGGTSGTGGGGGLSGGGGSGGGAAGAPADAGGGTGGGAAGAPADAGGGSGGVSGSGGAAGAGGGSALCMLPDTLYFPQPTFGGVAPGVAFGTVGVENCGGSTLTIQNPILAPGSASTVSISFDPINGATGTLAPNELMLVELEFDPDSTSAQAATLQVQDAAGKVLGQTAIHAQAIADPGGCVLQVGQALSAAGSSQAVMDMGRVAVGQSARQSFFVANAGLSDCQVSKVTGPTPAGPFSLPYPGELNVGLLSRTQSTMIDVDFKPTATGNFETTFTVASDDAAVGTRTLRVRGEGY